MNTYYGYLDADERASLIEETKIENELSRLETMYEMVELKLKQMENDVHLKVLTEAGTYDDYAYLMTEAEAAVAEEKKGILSSIIAGIKKFFKTIADAFRGLGKGGDPNEDIKVSSEDYNEINNKVNMIGKISSGLSKVTNGITSANVGMVKEGCKEVLSSPLTWAVAGTAGAVGGYKIIKRQVLQNHCQKFVGLVDTVDGLIAKVENSVAAQWFSSAVDKVKEMLNKIKEGISSIRKKFTEFLSGIKSDNSSNNNGNQDNDGGPVPPTNSKGQNEKNGKWNKADEKIIKGQDGNTYTITPNGKVKITDKDGKDVPGITPDKYPDEVKRAINETKNKLKEYNNRVDGDKGIIGRENGMVYSFDKKKRTLTTKDSDGNVINTVTVTNNGFNGDSSKIPESIKRKVLKQSYDKKQQGTPEVVDRSNMSQEEKNADIKNRNIDKLKAKRAEENKAQDTILDGLRFKTKQVPVKGTSASIKMDATGRMMFVNGTKVHTISGSGDFDKGDPDLPTKYGIPKNKFNKVISVIDSLQKEFDTCNKNVEKQKNKFRKQGKPFTESEMSIYEVDDLGNALFVECDTNLIMYYESDYQIDALVENDGYTIEETEDEIIFSPNSFNEITTEESIFGEFVESSIDDIIFEDRYEQELYDLAEKFANL